MTPIIVYARSPAEEQNRMPNFWDEPCLWSLVFWLDISVICRHVLLTLHVMNLHLFIFVSARYIRAGVCRPCVETELTATKKSATDGN